MMKTNTKNACQTDARSPYQPPQLQVWGAVSDLTRLGGSGGSGDTYPSSNPVKDDNPDGSVTWAGGSA
ncbi:lasso RiPP family leader peptide-containing protein [Halomonas daqiaonensis]|uniref:lasso RiPP family leader peptide-containing protein n=1 Tax=Halomonas daqiaonensis TaxID=650850 RepID=UPI001113359F